MSVYSLQAVFSRGELSPKLRSRADIEQFKAGLAACENWIVMRQGGIKRRPGTQYIGETKSSGKAILIPFVFSAAQAYVLEVGDFYFRVYSQGGRVGTVDVVTPWALADLFALDYDQTNDVLDVVHRTYAPQRISRLSNTSWTVAATPQKSGPFLPLNATATTLTPSATGNPIPTMTSNVLPSGTAAASTILGAPYDAYKAFDGDANTAWFANASTGWVSYDFGAGKVVTGYAVTCCGDSSLSNAGHVIGDYAPKSWTFEGWNGAAYVQIDAQFGQSLWSAGETRFFSFTNSTSYTKFRLNVSSNNGGTQLAVGTFSVLEDPSAAAAITLTASAVTGINSDVGFSASDVGRVLAILGADAVFHIFQISAFTSTTVVSAKLTSAPLPSVAAGAQWKLGAWGTTPGWPAHVCTFEGRKCFARTDAQPSGVWSTRSGGYGTTLDFGVSVPIVADDAITFLLADPNEIGWMAQGDAMALGTAGAARTLGRDSLQNPFSALNFRQKLESTHGSNPIRPVQVGQSTVFASLFGRALREFAASENGVGYDTPDISVMSEHLLASGIVQLAYAQEPDSTIWAPNGNGELIGMTYEKAQSVGGFHRHFVAGAGGFVESVCAIPGTDRNEVWMIVKRTINGSTKRYIERMAASFDSAYMAASAAWYVDCGLQYSGAPATAVSGLSHLEGQTVSILADGAREADAVVTAGAVSLASGRAASVITVGLSYRSRARTLPSPVSLGDGSGLGRKRKVIKASVDLLDTGSLKVGRSATEAEQVVFRAASENLGASPALHEGFTTGRFDSRWGDNGVVEMIADGPLPATVRSLTLQLEPEP